MYPINQAFRIAYQIVRKFLFGIPLSRNSQETSDKMGKLSRRSKACKTNAKLAREKFVRHLIAIKNEAKVEEAIAASKLSAVARLGNDLWRLIFSFNDDIFPTIKDHSVCSQWVNFLREHKYHFLEHTRALRDKYVVRLFDEDPSKNGGIYFGKVIRRLRRGKRYLVVFNDGDVQALANNDIILGLFDANHIQPETKAQIDAIIDKKPWKERKRLRAGTTDVVKIASLRDVI